MEIIMPSVTYTSDYRTQNIPVLVHQTYEQPNVAPALRSLFNDSMYEDANELCKNLKILGNFEVNLSSQKIGDDYHVTVKTDLSKNPKMQRDLYLASIGTRLKSWFVTPPSASLVKVQSIEAVPQMPEPSFFGDCIRAVGMTLGLLIDAIATVAQSVVSISLRAFRSTTSDSA
jgi:hypothetical protein